MIFNLNDESREQELDKFQEVFNEYLLCDVTQRKSFCFDNYSNENKISILKAIESSFSKITITVFYYSHKKRTVMTEQAYMNQQDIQDLVNKTNKSYSFFETNHDSSNYYLHITKRQTQTQV